MHRGEDATATHWHLVLDNLNAHSSASLVRYVVEVSGIGDDLGEKNKRGILHSLVRS
jgi:hypothetical protein